MSACAWCGKHAPYTIQVEPARYRKDRKTGEDVCVQLAVRAPACDAHRYIEADQPPRAEQVLRQPHAGGGAGVDLRRARRRPAARRQRAHG